MGSDQFSAFWDLKIVEKNTEVLYKGIDAIKKIAQKKKVKICFGSDLLGPSIWLSNARVSY
ncbi:ANL_collapsed_G0027760.mRNA.1.CDS.1 [Saccharomyces cerevisiae]|nr:ANL_collapsed_G0027760.mRNA.1.CDS.1 [Saccharomyces cerevisiae]